MHLPKLIWAALTFCTVLFNLPAAEGNPAVAVADQSEGEVTTLGGAFSIRWKTVPSPMPANEMFDLLVEITPRDGGKLDAIWLRADVQMPEHNHGMNTRPTTEHLGNGIFAVKGLLFHMSGNWELVFDVALGAVYEKAIVPIGLE